jgi:hypothetical protein
MGAAAGFLQRLGHLSAGTPDSTAVGGIRRWFGWLGVEALTKIGLKARRHRGHVVRISGIDLVAGWAKVRQRRRNRRPVHPERPIEMVFADPPRVVAPRAVPIASRPPAKPMSVQSMRSGSSYRPRAVNFCCSERCCNSRVALVKGWPPGASARRPGAGALGAGRVACAQFTPRVACPVLRRVSSSAFS